MTCVFIEKLENTNQGHEGREVERENAPTRDCQNEFSCMTHHFSGTRLRHCPASILWTPCQNNAFVTKSQSNMWLVEVMPWWGKSCITGERVSMAWAQSQWKNYWDSSFVRVSNGFIHILCSCQHEVAVDLNPWVCQKTPLIKQICYGVLHKTLVHRITSSLFLRISTPTTHTLLSC